MDTDDLVEFVTTLEPDETTEHYWSGIHPDTKHTPQRIQAYGTLEEMVTRLGERNAEGFGIFICVNAITKVIDEQGPRRKASQIHRVRAVFADWDNALKVPPETFPLPPSMIVGTSPGKYHIYWLVDDFPLESFEQAQRGIIAALGTDRTAVDLSREMRLPGFDHTKDGRTPVRLLECFPERRYGADEILGAFPYRKVVKLNVPWDGQMRAKARLTAAVVEHLYGPARSDGAFNMRCPWEHEHTTASTVSSTIYWPPSEDNAGKGYFKCMHAHCAERYADHLDSFISEKVAGAIA